MDSEIGFTLTDTERRIVFKPVQKAWPALLIGCLSACGMMFFMRIQPWVIVVSLIVTVAAIGLPLYYLVRKKYIYLSPKGLRGYTPSGLNVQIMWLDEVRLSVHAGGQLPGVVLVGKDDLRPLFVPQGIAESGEFRGLVQRYAPAHHPLRQSDAPDLRSIPEKDANLAGKAIRKIRLSADWISDLSLLTLIMIVIVCGVFGMAIVYGMLTKDFKDIDFKLLLAGIGFIYFAFAAGCAINIKSRRDSRK
jgi:hypothetical protein